VTLPVVVPLFSFNGGENSRTNPHKRNRRAAQIRKIARHGGIYRPVFGFSRPLWTCKMRCRKRASFVASHKYKQKQVLGVYVRLYGQIFHKEQIAIKTGNG